MSQYWIVRGGSQVTGAATITSDHDFFIVHKAESFDPEIKIYLNRKYGKIDIEAMSEKIFCAALDKILNEELSLLQGLPSIDYWTIRFVARILMGTTISSWNDLRDATLAAKEKLRRIALAFHATQYLNVYEDIYGLLKGGRTQEAGLLLGEVVSRCIAVANLHYDLCDPAVKWAVFQARRLHTSRSMQAVDALLNYVGCHPHNDRAVIEHSLRLCNALMACTLTREESPDVSAVQVAVSDELLDLSFCIHGFPSFCGAMNVVERSIRYLTRQVLLDIAR